MLVRTFALPAIIVILVALFADHHLAQAPEQVAGIGGTASSTPPPLVLTQYDINDNTKFIRNITIAFGDSVHEKLKPFCTELGDDELCREYENGAKYALYKKTYVTNTTTLPSATLIEFDATRMDAVRFFAERFNNYKSYLEIGCDGDELFSFSRALGVFTTRMVGVDPARGGTHRMTSDAFFAANAMAPPDQQQYFDVIFIDGLHEADQVFRDIQNALKWLSPNGTIMLHDSNPRNLNQQFKQPVEDHMWLGDTWKAVVAMRVHKDVEVVLLDIDQGVAVIRKRENKHPLPDEWVQFLSVNPIAMLNYNHLRSSGHVLHRYMTFDMLSQWLAEEK